MAFYSRGQRDLLYQQHADHGLPGQHVRAPARQEPGLHGLAPAEVEVGARAREAVRDLQGGAQPLPLRRVSQRDPLEPRHRRRPVPDLATDSAIRSALLGVEGTSIFLAM